MRESFWQYRLDCFAPKGLNTRQVDNDEGFGRNVYQKCFSLSIYIYNIFIFNIFII